MARLFDDASNQCLEYDSGNIITAHGFTVHAWVYCDVTTPSNELTIYSQGWVTTGRLTNIRLDQTNERQAQFNMMGSAGVKTATTLNAAPVNQWSHVIAISHAANSREIILNGDVANKGTSVLDPGADWPGTANKSNIGALINNGSRDDFFSGRIAEICAWNTDLSAEEAAALADGVHPYLVKPGNRIAYWRLWGNDSPEPDIVGGYNMTLVNSPTKTDHPPVMILPNRSADWYPTTAPSITIPVMQYYNAMRQ